MIGGRMVVDGKIMGQKKIRLKLCIRVTTFWRLLLESIGGLDVRYSI